ncbi:MAG: ABC transporter permease, partial [Propionibacteriaceae bacterium]
HGLYEAALSLGLTRPQAISEVIERHLPEALVPGLDQTRTVGLVTLPGAFVGVLLGGGTPLQAGAAQIIVLIGLLATQTITVVTARLLIQSARLLPADLREHLIL